MPRLGGFLGLLLVLILSPDAHRSVAAESPFTDEEILVHFSKGSDVFSPQEVIALNILPRSPKIFSENLNIVTVTLHRTNEAVGIVRTPVRKFPDDSTRLASTELEIALPNEPQTAQWIPVSLIMPQAEGVYEIGLSFQRKGEANSGHTLLQRRPTRIVVQSVVSCAVVDPTPVRRPVGELQICEDTEQPDPVDTANPAWWRRLTKIPAIPKVTSFPKLRSPGLFQNSAGPVADVDKPLIRSGPVAELLELWKAPGDNSFGSGHFQDQATVPAFATPFSALSAPESSDTVPWQAIPLSIKAPGKPHLLELEYPSGTPQTLGIAVVELIPAETGSVPTISAESIVDVSEEIVSDAKTDRLLRHRIVFWPKTKSSMLLLTNRQANRDALFGKVGTFQLAETPNRLPHPFDGEPQRLLAGYVHRPEIFESLASSVGGADWETFHEGTTRFVDRLKHGGYDGSMLVVAANGKTIYPSTRYGFAPSTGPLIGVDGRPVPKDVLEILARLFDREELTLIPAIDFNSPLPALEYALQRNPNLASELTWIGPNGPTFLPPDRSGSVSGPYYNLLHPLVQAAMTDAVRELAQRCARHPSFGGVSVVLSPEGFAQIPDPFWGIDDATIARFQLETNFELPDGVGTSTDPNRLAARTQFFRTNAAGSEAWILWRTRKIRDFYHQVAQVLTEIRPDATLYLSGGTMLDSPNIQQYCMPSLLHRTTLTQVLRWIGFDPALFAESPSVVFLRPSRVSTGIESETAAIHRELETAEFGSKTRNIPTAGALFFHESPPNEGTVVVPSDARNRRRFVQRLAQEDVLTFFDGGDTLPLGEEESFYPLAAAFRKLPKTPFQTFSVKDTAKPDSEKSLQPVTVRFLATSSGLFVYLLNDAPFSVNAKLTLTTSSNASLEDLSGRRPIDPGSLTRKDGQLSWLASLQPYDLIAVSLADTNAILRDVEVDRPMEICGSNGTLRREVDKLRERIRTADNGVLWDKLKNPSFDLSPLQSGSPEKTLVGWNEKAFHDSHIKFSGNGSLKLQWTNGAPRSLGVVLSDPFPMPPTGRLFATVTLGALENGPIPAVNAVLSVENRLIRSFRIESAPNQGSVVNGIRWRKVLVPFDRLPKDDLEEAQIGFELTGPGTIWIDSVMLYHVAFTKEELAELYRKVSVADLRCSADRISELLVLLEEYWPRYLLQHLPKEPRLPSMVVADPRPAYTESRAVPSKPPSSGVLERFKGWFSR